MKPFLSAIKHTCYDRQPLVALVLKHHVRTHWLCYILGITLLYTLHTNYQFGVGLTPSLPYHVYVAKRDAVVGKNDYAVFSFHGMYKGYEPEKFNQYFIKQIKGVAGDAISVDTERQVRVAGESVGFAKPHSRAGEPLKVIDPQIIPHGHFYVYAPHKDSFDSRYDKAGLIALGDIKARVIWMW